MTAKHSRFGSCSGLQWLFAAALALTLMTRATSARAQDGEATAFRLQRVVFEAGGFAAGGLGGMLGGALLTSPLLAAAREGSASGMGAGVVLTLGAGVGTAVGAPFGIWLAGNARDGNGGLGWTYLGSLVGLSAFGAVPLAFSDGQTTLTLATIGFVVGGILGYELSSDVHARATRQPAPRAAIGAAPVAGGVEAIVSGTF